MHSRFMEDKILDIGRGCDIMCYAQGIRHYAIPNALSSLISYVPGITPYENVIAEASQKE